MNLTKKQKEEIFENGYVVLPGVARQKLINVALRAINHSISKGIDPKQVEKFRATSYCPELIGHHVITDLLYDTGLFDAAESATEKGKLGLIGGGQIALRFPAMEYPGQPHPHIDGMYRPKNQVRKGSIFSFTALAGVFLSDTPNEYWGNFTVWPKTHRLFADYFAKHGPKSLLKGLPKVKMPAPVQIVGKAGDAILCHYQLAHTAVLNVSPYIRYAVFFRLRHSDHDAHGESVFTDIWQDWKGIGLTTETRRHKE
jgi:hypothetical protein